MYGSEKYAWAFAWRGITYFFFENLAAGKADILQALELDKDDAWYQLLKYWFVSLDVILDQNVVADLEKVFADQPTDYNAIVCGGVVYWIQNKVEESLPILGKAIQIEPGDFDAYFWQGLVQAELGRDDEALASLKLALEKGMPPVLLRPLQWVRERPDFYEKVAKPYLFPANV